MGFKEIKEKAEGVFRKSPKTALYIGIAAACTLVLFLTRPPEKKEEALTDTVPAAEKTAYVSYREELEERLGGILSRISGVGEVKVMITVDGSDEKVFAEDLSESGERAERKTVVIGSEEALLKQTKFPEVKGAVIVCDGGRNATVKEKVVNAVTAALDIPANKVFVTDSE